MSRRTQNDTRIDPPSRARRRALLGMAAAFAAPAALAQGVFPNRTLRIVVPFRIRRIR